ncbi:peptide deformylase [Ferruginivarius sediminum]|uniref:Peptide deformylase n=1 Tax=Ferruginivarius sediminum TaxID=2661937 RepID=A0A369TBJ7_9PROT|nr:peptide deformylase [Ferruginivarius sediminum]RDD61765.1 peptide deformylase [Ferruginivarius sediminum]
MAILKIARMGHPVLGRPAAAVEDPRDPALRQLADDMIATMRDAEGTGLAAPQVHQSKRLLVFFVDAGRARAHAHGGGPDDEGKGEGAPLTVLVNPDYEALSEEKDESWEACLSIPGLAGRVPRYWHIRYWGTDLEGNAIEREATGFHARVVQHECDHLDGVLFPQRMTDMSTLIFTSEMDRYAEGEARAAASRPRAAS